MVRWLPLLLNNEPDGRMRSSSGVYTCFAVFKQVELAFDVDIDGDALVVIPLKARGESSTTQIDCLAG